MSVGNDSLFRVSLERCQAKAEFMGRFYARFLEATPEARALFEQVNMNRQAEMLGASLALIARAGARDESAGAHLDELGQFHARLGVPARMYDQWLDCLVATAADCDPLFSPQVADAWRDVLGRGILRMKGLCGAVVEPTASGDPGATGPTVTGPTASPPASRE